MIKVYREHPGFDEYTEFDSNTGRLQSIGEDRYRWILRSCGEAPDNGDYLRKIKCDDVVVFAGATPQSHTRFPRRIYFQITRNCNLRCDYCFLKAERGAPHAPTNRILQMASFLGECGLMEVRLTGGEPTTHPDVFAIIQRFQDEGVYVSLATNGVLDRATLDRLCEVQNLWLICSVDGNRETHNHYRPGTFDVIVQNLKYLKAHNRSLRVRLTTVLTKRNANQMAELAEIAKSIAAESVTVIPLRPEVRRPEIVDEMVTAPQFKRVIEDLVAAQAKFGVPFTTTIATDYHDSLHKDPIVRKRAACASGKEACNLDYDAQHGKFVVYGCGYSPASDLDAPAALRDPFLAGTFPVDQPSHFLDVWRNEPAWRLYRDLSIKADECMACEHMANHRCTGSCPIQNIDYSSIHAGSDVLEQLRAQIARNGEWYCYKQFAP